MFICEPLNVMASRGCCPSDTRSDMLMLILSQESPFLRTPSSDLEVYLTNNNFAVKIQLK